MKTTFASYQLTHWCQRYGEVPAGWTFMPMRHLFRARLETSSDTSQYPLYSFTIEDGVTPKTDRYERSFLLRDAKNNQYSVVHSGDLVFNPMNLRFGAIAFSTVPFPVLVSGYYSVLEPDTKYVDRDYFQAYFRSALMMDVYDRFAIGSLIEKRRVHVSVFQHIELPVPPIAEQQRIATFLTTTDRAIGGLQKLIAAKRTLNKGLAQQLLTGQRRMPGFKKPWGSRRLDTIGRISKGAGITKEDVQPVGLPAVRYGELYTTYDVQITEVRSFVSPEAAKAAKPIRRGDLLLAGSGEDRIEIGKAAAYMGNGVAYAGGDVIIVSPNDSNSQFLAYLLEGEHARREFYRRAQGESIVHIYMRDVGSLELRLPEREEQDRIAAVLGAADREIVLLNKKLDALRELKKGLMQKLLSGRGYSDKKGDPS